MFLVPILACGPASRANGPAAPGLPAPYAAIARRNPFGPLPGPPRPGPLRLDAPTAEPPDPPPFRLAGIVSVGALRAAALEPVDGGDPFFLAEAASRRGWTAVLVAPDAATVELLGPDGMIHVLKLAGGAARVADPESALRKALFEIPVPLPPPTRAEVEATAPFDEAELDLRIVESLTDEAATALEAAVTAEDPAGPTAIVRDSDTP